MTIEQMKERKIELGLTCEMIAEASGVPLGTVQKIFGGITKAPRKQTIEAIERILRPEEAGIPILNAAELPDSGPGQAKYTSYQPRPELTLREPPVQYAAARKEPLHTLDDYYALPDDQRVELIDGVFFTMDAPSVVHQMILGDLYLLFRECADRHGMPCAVFLSPCDVRLDRDNYTMVQPDLLVLCHEYDIRAKRHEGAPDLTVEILSDSTRMKDMILKLYKYQSAGVREYWIIDPKHRTVTVHYFDSEDYAPQTYDFSEKIPVGISGGECGIDFSRILERIRDYYD